MAKYRVNIEANQNAPVFARKLAEKLTEKQMTQAELAKATEELAKASNNEFVVVSEPTISGWISGKEEGAHYPTPTLNKVISVSKALGVSIDYLVGVSTVSSTKENIKAACKTTGLSEGAVAVLQEHKNKSDKYLFGIAKVISTLLEGDPKFFLHIAGYLFHKYKPQYHPKLSGKEPDEVKEDVVNNVWLTEESTGLTQTIHASELPAVHLMNVQERLISLKEKMRNE